jgi:hypothetical protein
MGGIIRAIKSPVGLLVTGAVVGVIVDRRTGLITKVLGMTIGKIPTVGPLVLG